MSHLRWPLRNPRTVTRLLELAARAAVVRRDEGSKILLDQARVIQPNRNAAANEFHHLLLILEVAALAIMDGWSTTYEQTLPSGRKPDLWLRRNGMERLVEITVLSLDRDFRAAEHWSDTLMRAVLALQQRHAVDLTYRGEEILDDAATRLWLANIEDACQRTAADGEHRAVRYGSNIVRDRPSWATPGAGYLVGSSRRG